MDEMSFRRQRVRTTRQWCHSMRLDELHFNLVSAWQHGRWWKATVRHLMFH